tara:strand:- start:759 stop:1385 length:627 start_codon:yes stop_codon:yes gene_type:complete
MVMNNREFFDTNGYLYVPNMIDVSELRQEVPEERGQITYYRKDKFDHNPIEPQVNGSLSRWNYPPYKSSHFTVKKRVEEVTQYELLKTYFYDRFYFAGQELIRHSDRPACEISVTIQISSNQKEPWAIWFENKEGKEVSVNMKDGDGVIYRGCEREHWRLPLKSRYSKSELFFRKLMRKSDDTYHHQVFYHFVDSQGPYVWATNDYIR